MYILSLCIRNTHAILARNMYWNTEKCKKNNNKKKKHTYLLSQQILQSVENDNVYQNNVIVANGKRCIGVNLQSVHDMQWLRHARNF